MEKFSFFYRKVFTSPRKGLAPSKYLIFAFIPVLMIEYYNCCYIYEAYQVLPPLDTNYLEKENLRQQIQYEVEQVANSSWNLELPVDITVINIYRETYKCPGVMYQYTQNRILQY